MDTSSDICCFTIWRVWESAGREYQQGICSATSSPLVLNSSFTSNLRCFWSLIRLSEQGSGVSSKSGLSSKSLIQLDVVSSAGCSCRNCKFREAAGWRQLQQAQRCSKGCFGTQSPSRIGTSCDWNVLVCLWRSFKFWSVYVILHSINRLHLSQVKGVNDNPVWVATSYVCRLRSWRRLWRAQICHGPGMKVRRDGSKRGQPLNEYALTSYSRMFQPISNAVGSRGCWSCIGKVSNSASCHQVVPNS